METCLKPDLTKLHLIYRLLTLPVQSYDCLNISQWTLVSIVISVDLLFVEDNLAETDLLLFADTVKPQLQLANIIVLHQIELVTKYE